MSIDTIAAIEAALKAHIADIEARNREEAEADADSSYHEHLLSDWVLAFSTSGISERGDGSLNTCWEQDYAIGETSSPMVSLGLSSWLAQTLKNQLADSMTYTDDKDGEDGENERG